MDTVAEMLKTAPTGAMAPDSTLAACIRDCLDCAAACTACADACLAEDEVASLRRCIRINLDCADLCQATARVLGRQYEAERPVIEQLLELMTLACQACGEECGKHSQMHEHCRVCAEACRRCERSCEALRSALGQH